MDITLLGPAAAAALLVWAAVGDAGRYTIPNRFPAALALAFAAHAALAGTEAPLTAHLAVSALLFAAGAGLFALGAMGGGDVKLLAAAGLWAGPAGAAHLLVVMSVAGGFLALIVLALHRLSAPRGGERAAALRLPYGVAIATGGLAALAPSLTA